MSEAAQYSYSNTISERDIHLTPDAEAKMAELLAGAEPGIEGIRIFVSGGGCGGMAYGMTFAEQVSEYDSALSSNGCKLVVDTVAMNFLKGCEIDFTDDRFTFKNVFQAVGGSGTCGGCGGAGY